MYRHFRWLQAIENVSDSKTTFFELRWWKYHGWFFQQTASGYPGL